MGHAQMVFSERPKGAALSETPAAFESARLLVMKFDHCLNRLVNNARPYGLNVLASRVRSSFGLVDREPLIPDDKALRPYGPDSRTRTHVSRDSDTPGFGGEPRSEALLIDAHSDVDRVSRYRAKELFDFG